MPVKTKPCTIEGCSRPFLARGWCKLHYYRWKRSGDPNKFKEYERHGLWRHPMYSIWMGIKARTLNPTDTCYRYYGARGITVCERYRKSFTAFLSDVGERPSKNYSIDRVDSEGNYSCGICSDCENNGWDMNLRWATTLQQSFNQRLIITNKTGYRGVHVIKGKYRAAISVKDKTVNLGRFDTPEEAALAYNVAALQYRGPEAKLNVIR